MEMRDANNAPRALSAAKNLILAPAEKARGNNINFLRFVAASMVIVGHMGHFIDAQVPGICSNSISTLAVKIFFVLSGFLICESLLRDGQPFRYLVRRVFRIFPALVTVVLVCALVLGPLVTSLSAGEYFSAWRTWRYVIANCLMNPQYDLPGVFETSPYPDAVNGSLWTLPVEFSMYLVLPAVLFVLRRFHAERPGVLVLAFATSALALLRQAGVVEVGAVVWGTSLGSALELVPYFFFGSYAALNPKVKGYLNVQVAFMAFFLLACISSALLPVVGEACVMLTLPYVILSFSFAAPAAFGRAFAENDYSYGIYLWAFPTQQTLVSIFGPDAFDVVVFSVISFLVTFVFAAASWFLVERPASRLGKRVTKWSRSREAARAEGRTRAA